jgi:hypothetical protein
MWEKLLHGWLIQKMHDDRFHKALYIAVLGGNPRGGIIYPYI